ncbi:uncharacterized protein DSM5745_09831 [Aspergillus mulundensis]|uniref:Rhodopsin domain-containing protein n=1 Tax=Aspergillus mulundensis TaxID=1810919 RepID=A0A3D8QRZ7_9EURO|nr:Uncharacterized protein DSM5745_09831 [Aspergillus mulundensis]RDW64420.1 Uncharacterized protein DSM5745_09831 [Aspergillus mulundensis]
MSSDLTPAYLAEDRSRPALIGIWVVTALSAVVVLVRLYARRVLIRGLGWDDLFIVLAQLVSWATTALCTQILRHGSGRHLRALILESPESLVKMYKWLVTTQMVYMFNLYLCRVSGLTFYARLNPMPRFIFYLRLSFAFGRCIGSGVTFISTGALTIACDSLILLLPIRIVMGLQAKTARKVALLGILCFGIFAVVTSVLRMISMIVAVDNEADATWYFSPVVAWTCAEVSAAIVALSLPALRSIFGFFKERSTRDQSNSYPHASSGSRGIGLESVSKSSTKQARVFHGSGIYDNTVDIGVARSPSQEVLWDGYENGAAVNGEYGRRAGGKGSPREIRVTETVDVEVGRG